MRELKLFSVLQNKEYDQNEKLRPEDINIVINDITEAGITFSTTNAIRESAHICTRLLKEILNNVGKDKLQDVTYGDIPTIITELIAYMVLKSNQQKQGVY